MATPASQFLFPLSTLFGAVLAKNFQTDYTRSVTYLRRMVSVKEVCVLCQNNRQLVGSHIVPLLVYKRIRSVPNSRFRSIDNIATVLPVVAECGYATFLALSVDTLQ